MLSILRERGGSIPIDLQVLPGLRATKPLIIHVMRSSLRPAEVVHAFPGREPSETRESRWGDRRPTYV